IDLDRQEYNNDHAETRRHCSLEAFNLDDALFPSDVDVEREVLEGLDNKALYAAIAKLQPQQQELVKRVYFRGEKIVTIAAEEGVSEAAIRNRLKKITASLKKLLK
ncbi:MAG: sigma-70 family RNA polymerase sigma factor, partial [Oscillospiraceae bacterium]|nr:sigma-70 family RNA polymerase sigma factor [Oscillospiraceae bacterium]